LETAAQRDARDSEQTVQAVPIEEADILIRARQLAKLLDDQFLIPGTSFRIGLDAIVGLIPGVGDAITTAMAAYIVYLGREAGISRVAMGRMVGNVMVDGLVGSIPIFGDVWDAFFKANLRNIRILEAELERKAKRRR
jgi:hypothetical protein